jgi:hypothetical protein
MTANSENAKPFARPFTLLAVIQNGRLMYEALLLAASLRHADPGFTGRLVFAHPVRGPLWQQDPAPRHAEGLDLLAGLGAELIAFEPRAFGQSWPYGNKIEALAVLPEGEPFLFLDTDTLVTGPLSGIPFDFDRPSASMRREGSWPVPELYGPGYAGIWKSLYDRFGLDFDASLDRTKIDEHWERYLYFNAGWFFFRDPKAFGARFLDWAVSVRDDPPPELICQSLDPWLDQVVLPYSHLQDYHNATKPVCGNLTTTVDFWMTSYLLVQRVYACLCFLTKKMLVFVSKLLDGLGPH